MKFHLPWKREQEKKEYTLIYDGNGGRQNGERFVRRSFWLPDGGFGKEKKFVSNTDGGDLTVETVFSNSNLKCIGYYARKRTEEGWIWYGTDHNWHDSFYDGTVCKQLIPIAASVESLYEAADDEIYLVAQWEDEHGIRRNCGYEIFSKKLMAHAFGGMDGTTYHNTAEAFEHGKKEGYQSFEIDLSYTEDDRLVLCHGWTENNCKCTGVSYKPEFAHMTYEQAMQIPIHGHSIMDARQFYEKVKNEPAYTFEIDFHNIKKGNEKRVAAMLEDFRQDEGLLDRLLMQVYSQPMYEQIDSVYHFANYMYLVGLNIDKLDSILTYCLDHGICSVAMRTNFVTKENVRKVHDAGLYAFCYTVSDDAVYANYLFQLGVDMICTDFVTEKALEATKETFGRYPFMVWYNSNHKEAVSHYPETVDGTGNVGTLTRLKSGNLEYRDKTIWEHTGDQTLRTCGYEVPGKRFAGWKLRISIEGKNLWYSTDGLFHAAKDYTVRKSIQACIFKDGDVLPDFDVRKNMKVIMVAVWENLD